MLVKRARLPAGSSAILQPESAMRRMQRATRIAKCLAPCRLNSSGNGNELLQARCHSQKGAGETDQENLSDVGQRALAMFGAATHFE
jgi:hypothetical protein